MKFNPIYFDKLNCADESDVFQYLQAYFVNSITVWDYFVNWKKVEQNFLKVELDLNLLNYLIGKDDIEEALRQLLRLHPKVVTSIPILIAYRDSNFKILIDYTQEDLIYKNFNFSEFSKKEKLDELDINEIVEFVKNIGILELLKNKTIKNLPDYVFGIEVGLDSNARKNRSGTTMETIVNNLLQKICDGKTLIYMKQATASKLEKEWGFKVQVDKSERRFDFAIKNDKALYLIETNFYGGGGSKLKATAGEYKNLFNTINQ